MTWRGLLARARRPPLLDVSEAYERWAPVYPHEAGNELMDLEQHAMTGLLPDVAGRDVLDLGCGSGRYLRLLHARGPRRCVGIDPSRAMLARCRGASRGLVCGALPHLPLATGSIDVAVCGLVLGHLAELRRALGEVARILRPGGVLLYSDLHPEGARQGWRRTFVGADGREYAVRHHVHSLSDHFEACAAAGLTVGATAEPRVQRTEPWRGTPALVVVRAHLGSQDRAPGVSAP